MTAALRVEALKLLRSSVAAVAGTLLAVVVPALAAAFAALARSDSDSAMALKVRPFLVGAGWAAYLGSVAEIMSVGALLVVGVLLSWVVGREFTDGTVGALLALPTAPGLIVTAKVLVTSAWALLAGLGAVVSSLLLGLAIGLGTPDDAAMRGAVKVLVVVALVTLLVLPLAWVSTALRGYLSGICALLGLVVLTQVVTVTGAGAWFPYAAPSLWTGMGGSAPAAAVTASQLALAVPVGLAGAMAAARRWQCTELV